MLSDSPLRDRRLRVAVIPEQFPRDENDFAGSFTRDYIEAIRPHCEVTVLLSGAGREPEPTRRVDTDGVEYVTIVPALRGRSAQGKRLERIEALYRIGRSASELTGVDLIHAHGAVFHGVPAVKLGRKLGVPIVLTIIWVLLEASPPAVQPVPDEADARARGVRLRRERGPEAPDRGLGHQAAENRGDLQPSRHRALHASAAGRATASDRLRRATGGVQGGLRVAQAFAAIAPRLPGWTLTIAGEGPERRAIERLVANDPVLEGRVELIGPFTKAQLADLLASSDLFVHPSRHETFGLVLAEAMSAGLPVVAPDQTAPPEYVDDGCGVLVAPDDVDAIARAMEEVALDPGRYDGEAIRRRVVERFGFEAFGARLLAIYRGFSSTPAFAETTRVRDRRSAVAHRA